jgi:molybdopterin-guanine dinucleotide biosynthesis protein A
MKNNLIAESDRVTKVFWDRMSFDNELSVYRIMSGTGLVPELLMQKDKKITLRRSEGITLSEKIDEILSKSSSRADDLHALAEIISAWFISFEESYHDNTSFRLVNNDLNPRNILVEKSSCIGIDFEAARNGTIIEAAASLLGMILTMDMPDSEKEAFAGQMVLGLSSHFGIDKALLEGEGKESAGKIVKRRKRMKLIRDSSFGLLAGGKAERMGGIDKSSIVLGGYTFMERILHTAGIFDRILISSNRQYAFPFTVVRDIHADIGPMGALYSLLGAIETDHVLIIPCDTPLLKQETVFDMYLHMSEENDALVLRCNEKTYPVIGIYRKRILPEIESVIGEGKYALNRLLSRLNVRYYDIPDETQVLNVNGPEELAALKKAFEP